MNIDLPQSQTIALFAILFVLLGLVIPIGYLSIAPDSQFVDVHSFDAEDTYVGAEEHIVCFDRTVRKPSDADITVELFLIRDNGVVVEEDSFKVDAYFQNGRQNVRVVRKLRANSLEPGDYRYAHAITLDYYNGFVQRKFRFVSDEFTVYETQQQIPNNTNSTC